MTPRPITTGPLFLPVNLRTRQQAVIHAAIEAGRRDLVRAVTAHADSRKALLTAFEVRARSVLDRPLADETSTLERAAELASIQASYLAAARQADENLANQRAYLEGRIAELQDVLRPEPTVLADEAALAFAAEPVAVPA